MVHAVAREMGYKAEILYANILLASLIGEDIYDNMSKFAYDRRWMKLGERLFARSAHGLPPLGLDARSGDDESQCIGNLEKKVKVSYENLDFNHERLLEIEALCAGFIQEAGPVIASLGYKMVGCTSTLEQNNSTVALLNGIKNHNPHIITLVGGANCEGEMAEGIVSLSKNIDYVFSGESELSLKEFLTGFSQGRLPSEKIIRGEPIADLNTLPLPDYDSYFQQSLQFLGENDKRQRVISYETSRSCWRAKKGRCFFCGGIVNNHLFRQKSVETVLKDLDIIIRDYAVTNILMTDNIVPHFYYKELLPSWRKKGRRQERKKELSPNMVPGKYQSEIQGPRQPQKSQYQLPVIGSGSPFQRPFKTDE